MGGQTRMPALRARLGHFKRLSSEKDVHPELGVAVGAAILGRNLARGGAGLSDVVPMPIGVMAPGLGQQEVIPANTPVPAACTVSLDRLPPSGSALPVALFEAVDRTSTERELLGTVQVPPDYAAEMVPFDPLVGEFRVHYAGFFDPGFGYAGAGGRGARAVLEVRSREVPFILEHGQTVGRLVFEHMLQRPDTLYGQGIGSNYQAQGLKLSKHFRV